jgi:hypothetical protein
MAGAIAPEQDAGVNAALPEIQGADESDCAAKEGR